MSDQFYVPAILSMQNSACIYTIEIMESGQGGADRIHNVWNSTMANKPLNGLACLRHNVLTNFSTRCRAAEIR
jgi:hypothetical protein